MHAKHLGVSLNSIHVKVQIIELTFFLFRDVELANDNNIDTTHKHQRWSLMGGSMVCTYSPLSFRNEVSEGDAMLLALPKANKTNYFNSDCETSQLWSLATECISLQLLHMFTV